MGVREMGGARRYGNFAAASLIGPAITIESPEPVRFFETLYYGTSCQLEAARREQSCGELCSYCSYEDEDIPDSVLGLLTIKVDALGLRSSTAM